MTDASQTLTVRVPFAIRKRGGRKLVVKALARGFRWRKLLGTDIFGTIDKVAAKEKINSSYVGQGLCIYCCSNTRRSH